MIVPTLQKDFPQFRFIKSDLFTWVPTKKVIQFKSDHSNEDSWSIFHELGHGILQHKSFYTDIELLQLEVAAWDKAKQLAKNYDVTIDWRHIEQCIDSYRDWLHARSTCPHCGMISFQVNRHQYTCFNCGGAWTVSASRLCRIHRRKIIQKQTSN